MATWNFFTHKPKILTAQVTPAIPQSVIAYQKHGVQKSLVHHLALNHWSIPEIYRDCFTKTFLLHWTPEWFFKSLKDGTIKRDSVEYQVVYRKSPAYLRKLKQLRLSFRVAQPEFGIPAYVIVDSLQES